MRAHDRYWMPVSDGTEPSGWAAGLRRYVDSRYRMVASTGFDAALRSAVTNLRKTNLPVGLLVARGDHAWVLTGFTATADPARTSHFTVTSVRVTGPLWGLQSRSYGYDMRPDTRLTPAQLRASSRRGTTPGSGWPGGPVGLDPAVASGATDVAGARRRSPIRRPEPATRGRRRSEATPRTGGDAVGRRRSAPPRAVVETAPGSRPWRRGGSTRRPPTVPGPDRRRLPIRCPAIGVLLAVVLLIAFASWPRWSAGPRAGMPARRSVPP
jgi:hypothetical protein